ncbi:hypothetical protein WA026_000089, partial [Henosepilachna vigintioctopunctata]
QAIIMFEDYQSLLVDDVFKRHLVIGSISLVVTGFAVESSFLSSPAASRIDHPHYATAGQLIQLSSCAFLFGSSSKPRFSPYLYGLPLCVRYHVRRLINGPTDC